MRRLESVAVAMSLSTALLAGCSSPIGGGTGEATVSPVPTEASQPSASTAMRLQYELAEDASPDLAAFQELAGNVALSSTIDKSPFAVRVSDTTYQATISIPENPSALKQVIIITAKSDNAGILFKSLGFNDLVDTHVSATSYTLDRKPDGELYRDGPALSIVGQELTGPGAIDNMVTERCQAVELKTKPLLTDPRTYDVVKEAVCNTIGAATDRAFIGQPYAEYAKEYNGVKLGPDVNSLGVEVTYPVVSTDVFNALVAGLHQNK